MHWASTVEVRQTDDEAELIGWLHEAADAADPGGPEPGRLHALLLRRPRRLRAADGAAGRGAPVQPGRARGVPAHVGGRRGGDGTIAGFGLESYALALRAVAGLVTGDPELTIDRGYAATSLADATGCGRACVDAGSRRLLVTDLVNVRYLSGFTGSNAALLVAADADGDLLATDGRYTEQAAAEAPGLDAGRARVRRGPPRPGARRAVPVRVGLRVARGHRRAHRELAEAAADRRAGRRSGPAVEALREVKDDDELACCARPARSATGRSAASLPRIDSAATERRSPGGSRTLMLDLGADALSFETIVATGPNSSIPHHQPTTAAGRWPVTSSRSTSAREVGGYHSDMTRTVVVGAEPTPGSGSSTTWSPPPRRPAGRRLAPGVDVADVDRAARPVIEDAGLGDRVRPRLGHGVGLQIHEAPVIGAAVDGYPRRLESRSPSSPVSTSRAAAASGSRTLSWSRTGRPSCSPRPPRSCSSSAPEPVSAPAVRTRRKETPPWPPPTTSRTASSSTSTASCGRHRVPARQARQGAGVRADQAEERAVRQGRRQDVQRRRQGRDRDRRQARRCSTCTGTARDFVFMDSETYDQLHVSAATVGDAASFLLENQEAIVAIHDGAPLYVELPDVRRAAWSPTPSPACRATGPPAAPSRRPSRPAPRSRCRCSSPPATSVKVDTRDGSYLGRVN